MEDLKAYLSELVADRAKSGTIRTEELAVLLSRLEQAEQAVARVEKLLKDSEEVESVFTSQHDRIWIDCVRRALDGDGRE